MAIEIERKFLVKGKLPIEKGSHILQAYLSLDPERIVRIRIEEGCATVAIKGKAEGVSHIEFEYQIPIKDAQVLLNLSIGQIIEKDRYRCRHGAHTWEIDVFHGANMGLVVAEIELDNEFEQFELPNWVGEEVSDDPKYRNAMLAMNSYDKWKENK